MIPVVSSSQASLSARTKSLHPGPENHRVCACPTHVEAGPFSDIAKCISADFPKVLLELLVITVRDLPLPRRQECVSATALHRTYAAKGPVPVEHAEASLLTSFSKKWFPEMLLLERWLFSSIFPNLQYIWITRRNKACQVVSWWKAP